MYAYDVIHGFSCHSNFEPTAVMLLHKSYIIRKKTRKAYFSKFDFISDVIM